MRDCARCGAETPNKTYCTRCQTCKNRSAIYGVGAGEWAEAREALSGGTCDICGEMPTESLQLDHDHETGRWRGMICRRCNYLVGAIDNLDADTHERLLAYVGE